LKENKVIYSFKNFYRIII